MLEAQQLTKYYGAARAVAGISFCIQPGEVLGCLGPNGSGKSTTPERENRHAAEFIFAECSEAFDAGFLFKRDAAENPDHCRPFARSRDSDF